VTAVLEDMQDGAPVETISRRFHNTLADTIIGRLTAIRQETDTTGLF